jgi:hypothetical protein
VLERGIRSTPSIFDRAVTRLKTAELGICREPIRCGVHGSVWRYEQDKQRKGNDINRSNYAGGYALYAYDLTTDLAVNDHVNVSRELTVRLNLKFGAVLSHSITVVAYAEFENMVEINQNRNIVVDFSN